MGIHIYKHKRAPMWAIVGPTMAIVWFRLRHATHERNISTTSLNLSKFVRLPCTEPSRYY